MAEWKKKFMASGMAFGLILGGLTACGDGVDQDNGVNDGEQKDDVDNDNKNPEEGEK